MRKPTKCQKRQNAKKSPRTGPWKTTFAKNVSKQMSKGTKSMGWPVWDNGEKIKTPRNPRFPKGFKRGDFVTIIKSDIAVLEEVREESYIYMIVGTCWAENSRTNEDEGGFLLRHYDPTGLFVSSIDTLYNDVSVTFSEVALIDVSVLGGAVQKLNDLIQRIVKDGK